MSTLKVAALAAAVAGGAFALAPVEAQAQNWGHPGWHGRGHYAPAPQYVHPRVLRKEREMQRRVYQKYGIVQQLPYYHYQQPRAYHRPNHYGHRPHGYHYGW